MANLTHRQQLAYLSAMGIQAWLPREAGQLPAASEVVQGELVQSHAIPHTASTLQAPLASEATLQSSVQQAPAQLVEDTPAPKAHVSWQDVQQDDWQALQQRVKHCTACDLHSTRTQTVFGVGNQQADWLIVGEAPGADEDRQGEPFVGRAGQLLNNMLLAIGLRREQVYIANILKCRPPNNRDPRPEEVMQCEQYLRRQVELLQPKLILAVGRIAAQNLLKTDTPIGQLRGKLHYFGNKYGDELGNEHGNELGSDGDGRKTPLIITYHPAYLLRSPKEKRKAWQDLQFALAISQGAAPSSI